MSQYHQYTDYLGIPQPQVFTAPTVSIPHTGVCNKGHVHSWPTTGVLMIHRCEHHCLFCTGDKAAHYWKSGWHLRRHVSEMHAGIGKDELPKQYPQLQVSDGWPARPNGNTRPINKKKAAPGSNKKKIGTKKDNARPLALHQALVHQITAQPNAPTYTPPTNTQATFSFFATSHPGSQSTAPIYTFAPQIASGFNIDQPVTPAFNIARAVNQAFASAPITSYTNDDIDYTSITPATAVDPQLLDSDGIEARLTAALAANGIGTTAVQQASIAPTQQSAPTTQRIGSSSTPHLHQSNNNDIYTGIGSQFQENTAATTTGTSSSLHQTAEPVDLTSSEYYTTYPLDTPKAVVPRVLTATSFFDDSEPWSSFNASHLTTESSTSSTFNGPDLLNFDNLPSTGSSFKESSLDELSLTTTNSSFDSLFSYECYLHEDDLFHDNMDQFVADWSN